MIDNGFLLPPHQAYALLRSVYATSDAFAADFGEEYPSATALGEHLADLAARPGSLFLVAHEGAEALGFLFIVPRRQRKLRHTADLTMGLARGARGRGLGGELLAAALDRLRREGVIEIVYLMVRADNEGAVRLYERAGFERLAVLARDTKIGAQYYDGVLMRAFLSAPR